MAFLEPDGIGKSYRSGSVTTEVLQGINLSIDEGEFVAIVGFSGSGKTTLISTIAGLLAPDTGQVTDAAARSPTLPEMGRHSVTSADTV